MGGPASNGISRAPLYLGSRLRGIDISSTRLSLSAARFSNTIRLYLSFVTLRKFSSTSLPVLLPQYQQRLLACTGLVWTGPCSLTTTWGISSISFPPGTEMFHFSGFLTCRCHGTASVGLPHSEIRGSMPACGSPRRFVACYVFLRPYVPRHPSIALDTLTCFSFVLFGCQGAFHSPRLVGFCGVGCAFLSAVAAFPLKRNDEELSCFGAFGLWSA